MAEKYSELLSRSWDDIPEPKVLPEGTWLLKGRNVAYFPENEEKEKSARVAFFYEAKEPMDDVDAEALTSLGENYDFANNDIVKQFFINRDKDWATIRTFLGKHGIDTKGKTQQAAFDAFKGAEVFAYLGTKVFTDSSGVTRTDNDPSNFTSVE
jgi:hypothetical protein